MIFALCELTLYVLKKFFQKREQQLKIAVQEPVTQSEQLPVEVQELQESSENQDE